MKLTDDYYENYEKKYGRKGTFNVKPGSSYRAQP